MTGSTEPPAGSVAQAVERGRLALRHDDRPAASRWLERAARLAPQDDAVAFLLAAALAGFDEARCLALLRGTVARHPAVRAPRVALVSALLRSDDAAAAALALHDVLLRFAVPDDAGFAVMANQVCAAAGAPGWCGLGPARHLVLSPGPEGVLVTQGGRAVMDPSTQDGPVEVTLDGVPLLGSGLDPRTADHAIGAVQQAADGDLVGWASLPWNPDAEPGLTHGTASAWHRVVANDTTAPQGNDLVIRRGFRIARDRLPPDGAIRVRGPDGQDLPGSPVVLAHQGTAAQGTAAQGTAAQGAAAQASWLATQYPLHGAPAPGTSAGRMQPLPYPAVAATARHTLPPRRPIDVVIPLYRGVADLVACLAGLRRDLPADTRIVLVDDATPDPALAGCLDGLAARPGITVLRHTVNQGFPAAANTGLRHAHTDPLHPRDVLLLNPDTLPPPGLPQRLAAVAYQDARTGSVTPLGTDGTIVSYPTPGAAGTMPGQAALDQLDRLAAAANTDGVVEVPTGVGFCLFIRHDCLAATGVLRDDVFAQGYGEENDWCLRARHLGWRHVAATGVAVAHAGGQSFGAAKPVLIRRNAALLERLHPGYDAAIAAFEAADPLAGARRAMDAAGWAAGAMPAGAVVLVSHALGGGVLRFITERCAQLRQLGLRPIVVTPAADGCRIADAPNPAGTNLVYRLPRDWTLVQALLAPERPRWVEVHHLLGHDPAITDLPARLGVPYDVFVHDFHLWCPRVTFSGPARRDCGQPGLAQCETCVQVMGSRLEETIGIAELRLRSGQLVRGARRVVAPSADTAGRIARYVPGLVPVVLGWEDVVAGAPAARVPDPGDDVVVVVPGAIGVDKGFDVLLACGWDAALRHLKLRFVVVGHTMDDAALMKTGRVFITGAYAEHEAVGLLRQQGGDLGFIPSVWPETWCYTLSALLRAGLPVAAFDLGAQAERVRARGAGFTMPLHWAANQVNDRLLHYGMGTRPRAAPSSALAAVHA